MPLLSLALKRNDCVGLWFAAVSIPASIRLRRLSNRSGFSLILDCVRKRCLANLVGEVRVSIHAPICPVTPSQRAFAFSRSPTEFAPPACPQKNL